MAVNEPSPEGAGLFTSPSVIFLEWRYAKPRLCTLLSLLRDYSRFHHHIYSLKLFADAILDFVNGGTKISR